MLRTPSSRAAACPSIASPPLVSALRHERRAPARLAFLQPPLHTFGATARLPPLRGVHATSHAIPRCSLRDPAEAGRCRALRPQTAELRPRDLCVHLRRRAEASDVFNLRPQRLCQFNVLSSGLW